MKVLEMKRGFWMFAVFLCAALVILLLRLRQTGLSARNSPPVLEEFAAKEIRRLATSVESQKLHRSGHNRCAARFVRVAEPTVK